MNCPTLVHGANPQADAAAAEHVKMLLSTGMAYEFRPETIATRAFLDGYAAGSVGLDRITLERDNAKTCTQIHYGQTLWLERYVKLLKHELKLQELANLRKKRTIRGLREYRTQMRKLLREASVEAVDKMIDDMTEPQLNEYLKSSGVDLDKLNKDIAELKVKLSKGLKLTT